MKACSKFPARPCVLRLVICFASLKPRWLSHSERTFFVLAEASRLGVDLKKPMDGLCVVSCRLGHAFGRASGRRAQEEADFFCGENAQPP
jgi:hypothetical protein